MGLVRAILLLCKSDRVCIHGHAQRTSNYQVLLCTVMPPPVEVGLYSLQFRCRRRTSAFHSF